MSTIQNLESIALYFVVVVVLKINCFQPLQFLEANENISTKVKNICNVLKLFPV